jgi:hypothetical protein
MNLYDKIKWVHFAIQEAQNGNTGELDQAIVFVEEIREFILKMVPPINMFLETESILHGKED